MPSFQKVEGGAFTRGWFHASLQAIFLVVLTTTVAIFYERGDSEDISLIAMALWSITPFPCSSGMALTCIPSIGSSGNHSVMMSSNEDCILNSNHQYYFYTAHGERGSNTLCNLIGESPTFEREGTNLFAVLGIPFLLLASQVIATVFALMYIRYDSHDNSHSSESNVQKSLKKIALLMLIVYACSFLFLQNTWKIPGNNLFLVEVFLLTSIFIIVFVSSSHFSKYARYQAMPLRLGEFVFTVPLLTSAVLGAAGNTFITDITIAFFSVLFANAFLLLLEMDKAQSVLEEDVPDPHRQYKVSKPQRVILLNVWLCLIPFIMYCSLTINSLTGKDHYYSWTLTSIVALLFYEIVYVLVITIYNCMFYSDVFPSLKHDPPPPLYIIPSSISITGVKEASNYHYNALNMILDLLSVSAHICISMSIIGGALSSLAKSSHASDH